MEITLQDKQNVKKQFIESIGEEKYNQMIIYLCSKTNEMKQRLLKLHPTQNDQTFREAASRLYQKSLEPDDQDRFIKITMFEIALDTIL